MAAIAYRAAGTAAAEDYQKFEDDADIDDYAKEAVYTLRSKGVINGVGDGKFLPYEKAKRAEDAKIIHTLMEVTNNE